MEHINVGLVIAIVLAVLAIIVVVKTAVVVPQQNAFVVERLGKFHAVLDAGFHILLPFIDVIRYQHTLKEQAIDIPEQICITNDNVQVAVDGLLYLKVLDPRAGQLRHLRLLLRHHPARADGAAQRDRQDHARPDLRGARPHQRQVVTELDKASAPWGVKVLRYEIKNITPPQDVLAAMEKQMRAEREKRAVILASEGERDAAINSAEGHEAAGDQGVGGEAPAADQRGRGPGPGHPGHRHRHRRGAAQGGRGHQRPRAASRRCSSAWPRSTSSSSATSPRPATRVVLPANLSDVGSMIGWR